MMINKYARVLGDRNKVHHKDTRNTKWIQPRRCAATPKVFMVEKLMPLDIPDDSDIAFDSRTRMQT